MGIFDKFFRKNNDNDDEQDENKEEKRKKLPSSDELDEELFSNIHKAEGRPECVETTHVTQELNPLYFDPFIEKLTLQVREDVYVFDDVMSGENKGVKMERYPNGLDFSPGLAVQVGRKVFPRNGNTKTFNNFMYLDYCINNGLVKDMYYEDNKRIAELHDGGKIIFEYGT